MRKRFATTLNCYVLAFFQYSVGYIKKTILANNAIMLSPCLRLSLNLSLIEHRNSTCVIGQNDGNLEETSHLSTIALQDGLYP
jgi:hypothetical protein